MEGTSGSEEEEEEHTQAAGTPSAEANGEEPARTSHQPVPAVFVAPFFCLSLSSFIEEGSSQQQCSGFSVQPLLATARLPRFPLRPLPFLRSQIVHRVTRDAR